MDDPPSYTIALIAGSGDTLIYILSFVAAAVLLLMAAFIGISETVFFSLRDDDLDRFRQSKNSNEQWVAELLQKPRLLLATIRITGTCVTVGLMITFTSFVLNTEESGIEILSGVIVIVLGVAFTFFAEIIPKTFAVVNTIKLSRHLSGPWKFLVALCRPISSPWLKMSSLVERGVENKGYQDSVAELNQALEMAAVNHETSDEEKEILRGIVNFGTLTVKQVMRTKGRISAADITLNFHQLMDYVSKSGYSRVPVFRKNLDRIEGILHIKDLLPFMENDQSFEWQSLLRPGFFVPGAKKLDSLLKDFQEKHVHMAIVVNEYGGTIGLITLEDIIEEIIGDINDEFDEVGLHFQMIDEKTYVFEGKTSLHDFCKVLNVEPAIFDPVRGESKSLAGLILELNRELPRAGSKIVYDQFTFAIESADRKRIKRVKVFIHDQEKI